MNLPYIAALWLVFLLPYGSHAVPEEEQTRHGLVGLRPLPRTAAMDHSHNHGGSWAGTPTFEEQKGNYPFVAKNLDVVMGWLDGDFKTKRVFFEHYWGLSEARDDLDPKKNKDGSHPAFLLPGQELPSINARGYWVNSPCLDDGEDCDVGVDCCGGVCVPTDDGRRVCGSGEGECRQEQDRCSVTAECCQQEPPLECIGGSCARRVVR